MAEIQSKKTKPKCHSLSLYSFLPLMIKVTLHCLSLLLYTFSHSNREKITAPSWYMSVWIVCVLDWMTHCTTALLSTTGHPMLNHSLQPSRFHLCFFAFPSCFPLPASSPLCLSHLQFSLGLKAGTWPINTTAGSPYQGGGGGEQRGRKLTSLHSDLHILPPSWLNLTLRPAANHKWGWSASHPMALATFRSTLALSLYSFQ